MPTRTCLRVRSLFEEIVNALAIQICGQAQIETNFISDQVNELSCDIIYDHAGVIEVSS